MKKTLRFALLTAIVSAFSVGGVNAQTTLVNYPTSQNGIYLCGGAQTGTVKVGNGTAANTTSLDGLKLSSSYLNSGKLKQWISVKPEGGLKSGDVITIAGAFNNKEDKDGSIAIISGDGKLSVLKTYVCINGRKVVTPPVSDTYTLTADADSILIGRTGNTSTFITTLSVVRPSEDAPQLNAAPTSLNLNVTTDVNPATATFTLTGKNLTNGTYNLTVPSVAGLTVAPTSFTVADGAVNQEFTVSYTSDVNVKLASATITANVDKLNAAVAVNYSALVKAYEQETINASTTWDFSKSGINGQVPFDGGDIVLANVTGVVNSADFNSQTLVVNGQRIDKGYLQANTVKFKTSVPGKVQVVIGGTNKNTRKLEVNGTITDDGVNSTSQVTSKEYAVPAGDVILRGYDVEEANYNNFRWYKIIFTADQVTEAGTVTIKANFQRTSFSSDKAIDFSKTGGLTAYVVTDATGKVAAVTSVPANTGVIVERAAATAEAQTFTLYEATDAAAPAANLLSAASALTTTDGATIYGYGRKNGVEGFYLYKGGLTPTAGKAYLVLPQSSEAKEFISFGGNNGQTDAINAVIAEQNAENANIYNLAGQQVNKAYKGVVVVNGKKYIQK